MKISIIIPCYNEEKTISKIIKKVENFNLFNKEIIIIDDGSIDNTKKILSELSKENKDIKIYYHESNEGKGASLKTGIKKGAMESFDCSFGGIILLIV